MRFAVALLLAGVLLVPATPMNDPEHHEPVNVLTQHNNNARTGANLNETTLNTSNVNAAQFGKLYERQVDGQMYAQPLYVSGLLMPDGIRHNVVLIATMHDTVYLFDADNPLLAEPLWARSVGNSIALPDDNIGPPGYRDIIVEVGVVSTPVIDPASNVVYVVAALHEEDGYHHRLFALDLMTGADSMPSVEIAAEVGGTGEGTEDGVIRFQSNRHLQRSGLLLAEGRLFIAFASYGDMEPYHGWLMAYDPRTLNQLSVFCTTPNQGEGGVWQAGWGPASDERGSIYFVTGNGDFEPGKMSFGDAAVRLDTELRLEDYFAPYNQQQLQDEDLDLGSTGIMLVPGTRLLVLGGKEGKIYILDADRMGHWNRQDDSQIVQSFQAADGHIHGGFVYWSGTKGDMIYVWSEADHLKAFRLRSGRLETIPASVSQDAAPDGMPGAMLSLSAAGGRVGTGIVWATHPFIGDANHDTRHGILRAFDASDLSHELWNSMQMEERDDLGNFAKFNSVTVAAGKVFAPTFSNKLVVYGLLP